MKVFRRRPGVELVEICGEYLLVATREAREHCPYVTQINEASARLWSLLDRPCSVNAFTGRAAQSFDKEPKAMMLPVIMFMGKLSQDGYLIGEETE